MVGSWFVFDKLKPLYKPVSIRYSESLKKSCNPPDVVSMRTTELRGPIGVHALAAPLFGLLLTACASNSGSDRDLAKDFENGAYDSMASLFSDYCDAVFDKSLWIQRTRVEARREIRQSAQGKYGPKGPATSITGLDANTADGSGPVVRIWCRGETVPDVIWRDLVRDWKD